MIKLAQILALSSLRASSSQSFIKRLLGRGLRLNLRLSITLFVGSSLATYGATVSSPPQQSLYQLLVALPLLLMFLSVVYTIMFEMNRSVNTPSVDAVNWLPITPAEYVVASSLSSAYSVLPLLSIILGAALGIALAAGAAHLWVIAALLSMLALAAGSFIVEIILSITSRAARRIYKQKGRLALPLATLFNTAVIFIFVVMFNFQVLINSLKWVMDIVDLAWFIPPVWLSLAMEKYLEADLAGGLLFTLLGALFVFSGFLISTALRTRYWAVYEAEIRITDSSYTPKPSIFAKLGFTPGESAIIRKELKSFLRRREMAAFIAVPAAVAIIPFLTASRASLALYLQPTVGLLLFALLLSATSIGREGEAFLNLLIAPLRPGEIIRAKAATTIIVASPAMALILAATLPVIVSSWNSALALVVAGYTALVETVMIGTYFSSRFPDFTTAPRARFIRPLGMFLTMITAATALAATATPLYIYAALKPEWLPIQAATLLTTAIGAGISIAAYRGAKKTITRLFQG